MSIIEQVPLNAFGETTLDINGSGTVQIQPPYNETWNVSNAAVSTSTAVKLPNCAIYIGAAPMQQTLVDSTFTGNQNATGRTAQYPIQPGESIFAVWSGGDANATATLSLIGMISRKMPN